MGVPLGSFAIVPGQSLRFVGVRELMAQDPLAHLLLPHYRNLELTAVAGIHWP